MHAALCLRRSGKLVKFGFTMGQVYGIINYSGDTMRQRKSFFIGGNNRNGKQMGLFVQRG